MNVPPWFLIHRGLRPDAGAGRPDRYLHGARGQCEFAGSRGSVGTLRVGRAIAWSQRSFTTYPAQRVVFGAGTLARVAEEAARLGMGRALVIATPGSGARLGRQLTEQLGARAAGLHAQAVIHVPKAVADAGFAAARAAAADGLVAAGGGAAIGLAKIIARDLGLPILAVPTTYSGSEATTIWGISEGERKSTGRDHRVLPRTVVYDPELTLALPAPVSAASGLNALAHCVGGLMVPERTPVTMALRGRGGAPAGRASAARGRRRRRPGGARRMPARRLARRHGARRRHRACSTSSPTCSAAWGCRTPRPTRSSCRT